MATYVLKRLLLTIPTFVLVALAVFGLMRLIPGDPAQIMLGEGADAAAVALLRHQMGLDRPLPVQFAQWLENVLRGDFGHSIRTGQPVLAMVIGHFEVTASIVFVAMGLATLIAIAAGLVAAWRRHGKLDLVVAGAASIAMAIPSFWLGLVLLLYFGMTLRWFPVVGFVPFVEDPWSAATYLVLPIAALTVTECGVLVRMMRASAIGVLRLDYITHARAKGVGEFGVLTRHVLPNAFAPTLTLLGLSLGHLLGGIAVLETVFTLPGLGRLMVDAVLQRDYPVVQGCLLFTAAIYILVNLAVDLCYPLFDPQVVVQ